MAPERGTPKLPEAVLTFRQPQQHDLDLVVRAVTTDSGNRERLGAVNDASRMSPTRSSFEPENQLAS